MCVAQRLLFVSYYQKAHLNLQMFGTNSLSLVALIEKRHLNKCPKRSIKRIPDSWTSSEDWCRDQSQILSDMYLAPWGEGLRDQYLGRGEPPRVWNPDPVKDKTKSSNAQKSVALISRKENVGCIFHLDSWPLGDTWYGVILWLLGLNIRALNKSERVFFSRASLFVAPYWRATWMRNWNSKFTLF